LFKTSVVLGDPIVSDNELSIAIQDFKKYNLQKHNHVCFFICTNRITKSLFNEGFKGFLVGHEAIVNLEEFDFSAKNCWSIRSSLHKAKKLNMIVEEYKYKTKRSKNIENELHRITREWCRLKQMSELTFAFGHVDFDKYPDAKIFLCKFQNNIIAYLIYFPIYGLNSYYLDLSRRELNAPRGAIDFLFVKSFEILKKAGIKKVYIGYSPTSYSRDAYLSSRFFMSCKPLLEIFYPAKSEFFFKNKYATEWEPNYFFYHPHISIRMLFALVHSVYNGGLVSILINKFKRIL
jgi:phosphatidylglycerol lysyltransferase